MPSVLLPLLVVFAGVVIVAGFVFAVMRAKRSSER